MGNAPICKQKLELDRGADETPTAEPGPRRPDSRPRDRVVPRKCRAARGSSRLRLADMSSVRATARCLIGVG